MKNILFNIFKKNYFLIIIKKIFKKFEKNTSHEAKIWAKSNVKQTTEEFCRSIDTFLYDEVITEIKSIQEYANLKLSKLSVSLGGGANYLLLYFIIRKLKPLNIVETGVAAGWSSLSILRAIKKNGKGFLYSSDFPYFRLDEPEQYIGYLAKNEENSKNWFLDIRGDDVALPQIIKKLEKNIDLLHYDSDKTYSGRSNAMKILNPKINSKTIIIFDDIQDNLHFRDIVNDNKRSFCVIEFEAKFVGIVGYEELFTK